MKRLVFFLVFAATTGIYSNAQAQISESPQTLIDIRNCVTIQNDSERLACYDNATSKLAQAIDTGEIMIVDKVTVEEAKKEGFGLNLPSLSGLGKIFKSNGEPELPDNTGRIQVDLKSVEPFGYKKNRFFLENGQVWDQVESRSFKAPKKRSEEPYFVVISKAALGSFYLQVNDKGKKVKVKRVK